MLKIRCFGIAKEIVGNTSVSFTGSSRSVADLRLALSKEYPEFKKIKGYMVAINQEYATDDQIINDRDEIAIIPPVSGG